jgi:hypothetical protein
MPDPILNHASGFDNYFFERYLHTIVRIFVLLGLTIPPILLPLNFIDGRNAPGGVKGLDRLSFSNIGPSHTDRYWAHLALAIFVVVSVCVTLQHELRDYRRLRNSLGDFAWDAYEPLSVLLVSKSNEQLSINAIRPHFSNVAGGIYNITVNRDYSSLHAKLRKRDRSIENLEIAATNLIIKANCRRKLLREQEDEKDGERGRPMPLWMKYLYPKDRPSTRIQVRTWIPCLPFLGPQVDTICHFRKEVAQYNLEVEWDQRYPSKFPETNSAFVYFNKRLSMPLAALVLKTSVPPSWTLKLGTTPDDTIWQNVSISWWQQCIRRAAVYLLVAVLTLGFAFPVTIIGTLSQIKYLANVVSWLHWINKLPTWLVAVIQGVLPPTMLALITAMVPVVFRFLANVQGHYSRRVVENHIQIYYFTFLFVQVFLTVSLSAGITTIIGELKDTIETVPAVLAINLPKACNYFFSYIMIHTLSTIMQTLLQISLLVELLILSPILDKTARHMWARGRRLDLQKWGTFIPVLTNIACVGVFLLSCCSELW